MMSEIRILGIYISDRVKDAARIQPILSRYGCSIKTRLGLHDTDDLYAENSGIILLELVGDPEECLRLENELLQIDELEVQKMIFSR